MFASKLFQNVHHHVHQLFVQRAEPFVEEEKFDRAQGFRADRAAQGQRQRQGDQKGFAARQSFYGAQGAAVEIVPRLKLVVVLEIIPPARQRQKRFTRRNADLLKVFRRDKLHKLSPRRQQF